MHRALAPSEIAAFTVSDAERGLIDLASTTGSQADLAPLVRAQVLIRAKEGASDADLLFASTHPRLGEVPSSARAIQQILRKLTKETGILFPGASLTARHDDDAAWGRAAGLKVLEAV